MELRHLRYFLVLAEELHFGKAAKRLFISQPPLSRQIKDLELELGVPLFLRDNKRVLLTEAGKFFYKEAQAIFTKLSTAKQQVGQIHASLAGEIKIGYISSVDKKKLGELIGQVRSANPFLQTKLFELPTLKQIAGLESGQLDIGIIRAPNSAACIKTDQLYADGFCLALPNQMKISKGLDYAILEKEPFISYHASFVPVYHMQVLAYAAELGFTPKLSYECNNISSILELVHLNAGFSIVPKTVQYQYGHLGIQFLNVADTGIKTDVLLAYHRDQNHPAFDMIRGELMRLFRG